MINDAGSYEMSGGAQLWTSNTTVQFGNPSFSVFLGHHHVENSLWGRNMLEHVDERYDVK